MGILEALLSFLIGLAANGLTAAVVQKRGAKLKEALQDEEKRKKSLFLGRSLRHEVVLACTTLARDRDRLGVTAQEEPLLQLLQKHGFQEDLTEWFMSGAIKEGAAAKERLIRAMETALSAGGASAGQIEFLKTRYFEAIEKTVYSDPFLAHWRHQLSLDFLRQQVSFLQERAEEAAGIYSPEKQRATLEQYCQKALNAWDIIDLSNLPEGDIHIATQKLLLRKLYMPLRIVVQSEESPKGDDDALSKIEQDRDKRRLWEAGRLLEKEPTPDRATEQRYSLGERLGTSPRLVILGDPGGGKTTMLRWLATAYLLRRLGDPAFDLIPDTSTLPNVSWIPILIRCRDLGEADLCRCFSDFLTQHLYKTELLPDEAAVMKAVILDSIAKGEALLLVDGLDEITDPHVRMMFCQELERTAARYPAAPIVVTSRIVGYRDMPYRMGSAFEHGIIAELSREDKDHFAQRWVEVTEQHLPPAEKEKRSQELLDALHSTERIERLTGNPMLLTTMALVKRKVGKLPSRRTKLYAEAVSVLLNWNPRIYETIEEDEAIPQLEYLAYEMCRQGVQRLTEDEVLSLLDRVRDEYPNVRAIRKRGSQEFLSLLEARSSILIKSGGLWERAKTQEQPVWEFRHLTFQEYLAARALIDGRYPGRDKTETLAQQVAPLAGSVKESQTGRASELEFEVVESWQEALRLLVADCQDDDVDDVLRAIVNPIEGEEKSRTSRARAVLAVRALADEPNVSEETAQWVLENFVAHVNDSDGEGSFETSLDAAALELGKSLWAPLLKRYLIREFRPREQYGGWSAGGLWGMIEVACAPVHEGAFNVWFTRLSDKLRSDDESEATAAALAIMEAAFEKKAVLVPGLIPSLLNLLRGSHSI